MLTFRFSDADGVMVESDTLTSGMTGKIVKLEFTSDWENRTKTAVFTAGPTTVDVLNVGEEVVIPHEVLQNYGDRLYVGIYGIAEDGTALPTIYARGPRIQKGADPSGDESTQATLPVWAQLQTQIDELKQGGTGGGGGNDSGQSGNGIYIGSGEMPEGYNIQIDPNGEAYAVATQAWVTAQINLVKAAIPSITGLAAETWVTEQIQAAISATWGASY